MHPPTYANTQSHHFSTIIHTKEGSVLRLTHTHAHIQRHLTDKDLYQKISVFERLFSNSVHQHLVSDPVKLCCLGWNRGSKGFRRISLPFHKSKLSKHHQCDTWKHRKGQQLYNCKLQTTNFTDSVSETQGYWKPTMLWHGKVSIGTHSNVLKPKKDAKNYKQYS